MTRSKLLSDNLSLYGAFHPAFAQGRGFSKVDSNGDGVLNRNELASVLARKMRIVYFRVMTGTTMAI